MNRHTLLAIALGGLLLFNACAVPHQYASSASYESPPVMSVYLMQDPKTGQIANCSDTAQQKVNYLRTKTLGGSLVNTFAVALEERKCVDQLQRSGWTLVK
jgi:hypothetical protein